MQEDFQLRQLHGQELGPWLDVLGKLRIRVFREFPYLYDGSLEYERDYLGGRSGASVWWRLFLDEK